MEQTESSMGNQLNADQFLNDISHWSREVAEFLARKNFIVEDKLTPEHWKIIEFVHDFYRQFERGPSVVRISRATGFNMNKICELFPCGVVRGAYRLAGLPRPPGCI